MEKLCLKGKVHEKSRNPRSYQSSFLQLFEKEILKKKIEGFEKERKKLQILSILE